MAALGAIVASALAGAVAPDAHAAKKKKAPVITSVSPKHTSIGEQLTIRGRNFVRGRYKNTVVFKRDNAKAVFVKAEVGTKKMIRVTVSEKLADQLLVLDGTPIATPFRLRVLSKKLSKKFTRGALVPLIGPKKPPVVEPPSEGKPDGDCDLDKVLNKDDLDDDNDLLADATEAALKTDPCTADTDSDGVTDGYEFQSAVDLNDDEYREPQNIVPAPARSAVPEPPVRRHERGLRRRLAHPGPGVLALERVPQPGRGPQRPGLLGRQPVLGVRPRRRRPPSGRAHRRRSEPEVRRLRRLGWGQRLPNVWIEGTVFDIRDADQSGGPLRGAPRGNYEYSELRYFDFDYDFKLSDDERDEDADGLTNYDEATGRMTPGFWAGCYTEEKPYPIAYRGTNLVDGDVDGDRVRDGADDQDHDDLPNLMELSRNSASGRAIIARLRLRGRDHRSESAQGRGQPVQPLPAYTAYTNPVSRTCDRHPSLAAPYFPFTKEPGFYMVLN